MPISTFITVLWSKNKLYFLVSLFIWRPVYVLQKLKQYYRYYFAEPKNTASHFPPSKYAYPNKNALQRIKVMLFSTFSTRASRSMSLKVVVVIIVVVVLLATHWKLTSPDGTFSTKLNTSLQMVLLVQYCNTLILALSSA